MLSASPLFAHHLFLELPPGVEPSVIASTCRSAAIDLLDGCAERWGKAELAEWLNGPYRMATQHARSPRVRPAPMRIEDHDLVDVHERVVQALEDAARGKARVGFVERALSCAHVAPCVSTSGECGWVPAHLDGAPLVDRVLALFAVDCLESPRDYARALAVCSRCARVSFDVSLRERGGCALHAPASSGVIEAAPEVIRTPPVWQNRTLIGTGAR